MSIVVVGGYGNAGRRIVELLLRHTDRQVVVTGRRLDRARALVETLADSRATAAQADATDPRTLAPLLEAAEILIVAAGTSTSWRTTARAALDAGCHQLDIQIGSAKNAGLRALDPSAREAGVTILTDCGFHPGVPAAMVRQVDSGRGLATAIVSSWIAVDWAGLGEFADSTIDEMLQEFADYRYEAMVEGEWIAPRGMRTADFPPDIGERKVAAMGLDEMHEVAATLPDLRTTGFYVGGFPPAVNYGVIPVVYAGMRVAPRQLAGPLGRLLNRSLRRFSKPPFTTVLQVDGACADAPVRPLMRLRHQDAYLLTAAPVVAAVRQVLDTPARPGVHLQAMYVEPAAFFDDLAAMGVHVWTAPYDPSGR
ncbi:MAG: saccharopine dehydrogenase NADP-binding domain-containing protein [Actinobacteria bacterium]|nr:saccharopine dehydrogenase NADP-binding domain-containing protein [Actinomycetota bacterium]MCB8998051.1 saccharopine dehydrogenase NADP-binding domain-containing protein [Actinomycetota bacterium]MCB9413703.1 saccharopine dehydrogenase NADP-binding domain-containing protein [Actinomycetota bacterium]MCB9424681.1 saccharopine dehydrogenase NADP-binding domain-containing protein [Actinomycetota bacterium]HRY08657.1 saccharopine dehydrogenase NADP-binding domain-containing protein [Candidatus 